MASKVVRFPGMPSDEEIKWEVEERERLSAERQAEPVYAFISLRWNDGREWDGFAKKGKLGCYAVVGATGTAKYVPVGREPRTPQEAVAAVRTEEAQVIALNGNPDGRVAIFVADGDVQKAVRLHERVTAARDRLVTDCISAQFFAPKWLRLALLSWRWHRLMWKDWRG